MIVLKFGGTSVGSAERIKHVANLITNGQSNLVVLSAMSGTTNTLVSICNAYANKDYQEVDNIHAELYQKYLVTIQELLETDSFRDKAKAYINERFALISSFKDQDFNLDLENEILAQGELLSTHLMQYYLEEQGHSSVLLSSFSYMKTQAGEPDLPFIEENLNALVDQHLDTPLFITQGYICLNEYGKVDNLQRGGSDYTAAIAGAAINADEIQIWTDIDGMHNNDPRFVEGTKAVEKLSFDEAAELAYFGAKILHPATTLPAKKKNIPVRLLNTMNPQALGTTISMESGTEEVKSIAAKNGITAIKIRSGRMLMAYGFLKRVFEVFEKYETPIDMITTSEVAVSLTIDNNTHLSAIIEELNELGQVEVDEKMTIICVVGQFLQEHAYTVSKVFSAMESLPVRMISYGGSKHNVSVLLNSQYKKEALNLLHERLFETVPQI